MAAVYALTPGGVPNDRDGPVLVDGEVSAVGVAAWADRAPLEALEVLVGTSQAAFVLLGLSLRAIERRRNWPPLYPTFPEYVAGRWGMAYPMAKHLMRSAEVVVLLEEAADTNGIQPLPSSERTARELSPLRESPGELVLAWRESVTSAPRRSDGTARVTAKHVRGVVTRYRPALAGRREALLRAQLEGAPEPAMGAVDLALMGLAKAVADLAVSMQRSVTRPSFAATCDEVDAADIGEALRGAETWLKRARGYVSAARRKARAG